ncbi:acyl-CoA-like ligand-binding transcription factor [Kitasatospora cathayae]|uniref:TetR family transcriptional regulator n=1 Tax=Kitasatospora cathayae TaxID=3004092 RepID=A0ABY7QDB5_9ACTN|nr:TetR family transcriptional regulator [Kitasatospora sp. HUAS 3-15]WBP90676.1 TetR family transcriptional regulator [Kitasatospora sp. HUAS 3-15]
MTNGQPGLRERKKAATREALSWAALCLAVERGLENVRVEDIAAAAGVSPRTYNNYFSSKAEAIVFRHRNRILRTAEALRARPAEEPLWEALTNSFVVPFEDATEEPAPEWIAAVRLLLSEPALQAELSRGGAETRTGLVAAIAARTGTDAARDLYPKLVASAALSAMQVAYEQYLTAEPAVPFLPVLAEALRQLAAGLPEPSRSTEQRGI